MKPTEFRTRTGRIVWTGSDTGSLYDPVTTDFDGNPLGNYEDGTPKVIYRLGLAIKKSPGETHFSNSPEGAIVWAQGHKDHPQAAQGRDFSWKVVDGDSAEKSSKAKTAPKDKEGYPGHWVYTISSGYPFKFVNADGSAYLLDRGAVKVGDYVQVLASVVGNTGKSPGVYINHRLISLQGLGDPITTGPDPKLVGFGSGPQPDGMLPVGARSAGMPPPPSPAPSVAPPPPPPPSVALQLVPQVPVVPAPSFVGAPVAAANPPPPPPPAAPAVSTGPTMTAKANGIPYATFIANRWTDAQLREQGYMV